MNTVDTCSDQPLLICSDTQERAGKTEQIP